MLASTKGAADDVASRLCSAVGGLFGIQRMTSAQFASVLAAEELARRNLAPVSRLDVEALAARCVHRAVQKGAIRYFKPVAGMPGFARALASTA